jgi:hypothetical protein
VHPAYPHVCNLAFVQTNWSCISFWRFLLRAFLPDTSPVYWLQVATTIGDAKKEAADIQAEALMDAAVTSAQGQAAAAKELATASTVAAQTRADVDRERMEMERQNAAEKLAMERNASTHEQILRLAEGFDASMPWQERIKAATKLHKEITELLDE